ncbi:MAG: glycerol-3-phosphate acyltransferase [Brevinematales bacterium]|jgi:glycerol-3-phosphate acyltransferase PlsY
MDVILIIAAGVFSYLLGSVPFGLVYSLARGVDIRKVGSKNIGATNVSRQFGFALGFVPVFILDLAKGALPVFLAASYIHTPLGRDGIMVLTGIMAIAGHMFPVYLGFRCGKGVATALGVFILIAPYEIAMCLPVFIIVLLLMRFIDPSRKSEPFFKNMQKGVGLSSCAAAVALPISVFILESPRILILVISILVALLLVYRHRSNLVKIFKGDLS